MVPGTMRANTAICLQCQQEVDYFIPVNLIGPHGTMWDPADAPHLVAAREKEAEEAEEEARQAREAAQAMAQSTTAEGAPSVEEAPSADAEKLETIVRSISSRVISCVLR